MSEVLRHLQQIRERARKVIAEGERQVADGKRRVADAREVEHATDEMIAVLEGGVTDAEARRRRRGMHLAVIPAGLGLAVAAKENPVASGIAALTASAIIGAIVLMPPGQGGDPRDTAPGVIAGPQAPASPPGHPRQEPPPPPPVNLRPAPTEPSPQTPPKTQTADLRPAPTRRGPVDVTPITEQQTPDVARQACIRVRVTGVLAVRLLCGD